MIKKRKKALIFGILCVSAFKFLSTACNTKQSQDTNIRPKKYQESISNISNLLNIVLNENLKNEAINKINDPEFQKYSKQNEKSLEIIYNKLLKQVNDEKQIINNKINQVKNENKKNDLNNEFKKAKMPMI
ncbi:hypothetical protein [Mycoplasmopsis cynos]|uniref:hypothetical protein n=1 Tax=Mycoplasmopsis cynos TaxID=171284 RepID=UPI00220576D7|nr:hypothetical protein [Mycoplasmopsis cynos]UWV81739.1 hypothetical protein NW065_01065 [Mycoplasmopsis cynos]